MQRKTNAPQQMLALVELVALGFRQKAEADHFTQRRGAKVAARHPLQRVDIAQAARAAFNVRLQVVAGAVIALVALVLLFHFGGEEFF